MADDNEEHEQNGEGIDLTPELLLGAYAAGVFPMAEGRHASDVGWYDPERRGILPLDGLHIPARLRRTVRARLYDVTFNHDFPAVIRACADARRETWINDTIIALYERTHYRGFAHSVEVREKQTGTLVGGLYGIALGGAFFGESMFSTARDASKVGFVHLAARLRARGFVLWDAQFVNSHLLQFGCIEISRAEYHRRLQAALLRSDVRFDGYGRRYNAAAYSPAGAASVSSGDASVSTPSGLSLTPSALSFTPSASPATAAASAAASSGATSDENFSDFAEVADFLQSITQTS